MSTSISSFSDVDKSLEKEYLVDYLQTVSSEISAKKYKQITFNLL